MTKEIKGTRKRRLSRQSSSVLHIHPKLVSEVATDNVWQDFGLQLVDDIPTQTWEPTAIHWHDIEKACTPTDADGGKISRLVCIDAADREEISRLVGRFFRDEPFEPSAPFEVDVQTQLTKLSKPADQFYQALLSTDTPESEIVKAHIDIHLEKSHCTLSSIDDFVKAMCDFLTAVEVARRALNAAAGKRFVEGESWGRLVKGLARFFESKGLRATASKGDIGKPSAFVAFVYELQSTFPERFKRHHHSVVALAKAISDALAGR